MRFDEGQIWNRRWVVNVKEYGLNSFVQFS